ncbi:DUF5908 family protein [Reichenbachiella sp.]
MPVEIKELIIRTNIVSDTGAARQGESAQISPKIRTEIIDACVEKLMKIIEKNRER